MAMPTIKIIENLELDHLDFAEACALVDCLAAALDAMATVWTGDNLQMDRLALIHAAAMRRQHRSFVERERERETFSKSESKRAEAEL